MALRFAIFSLLLFTMAACSFKKPSAQSPEEKAAEQVLQNIEQQKFNGQLSEENVRVEFAEEDIPGMYNLVITWPKDVPGMKISLNNQPFKVIANTHQHSYRLNQGEAILAHLVALNSLGGEISSHEITGVAPRDLILQSQIELTKDETFIVNRVYISEESKIITHGHDLTIDANKLISSIGTKMINTQLDPSKLNIATTRLGTPVSNPKQVKNSEIIIRAKKATGLLRVGMFGFDGVDGGPGANTTASPVHNGAAGAPGQIDNYFEPCIDPPCGRMTSSIICSKNPTSGQNGLKGFPGSQGENGMNGGDSGSLAVFIADSSEFHLEVTYKAGAAGKGGSGGLGAPGGQGGAPGENPLNKCLSAHRGADGPTGDPGPPGANGRPGKVHDIITNVKNTSLKVLN